MLVISYMSINWNSVYLQFFFSLLKISKYIQRKHWKFIVAYGLNKTYHNASQKLMWFCSLRYYCCTLIHITFDLPYKCRKPINSISYKVIFYRGITFTLIQFHIVTWKDLQESPQRNQLYSDSKQIRCLRVFLTNYLFKSSLWRLSGILLSMDHAHSSRNSVGSSCAFFVCRFVDTFMSYYFVSIFWKAMAKKKTTSCWDIDQNKTK